MTDGEPLPADSRAALDLLVDGLDYPMFVVTAAHDGQRAGCLVGFATQTSIDPPRLLVCLSVANHTQDVAQGTAALAVHLLGPDQHELAALFGSTTGDEIDKFARCRWRPGWGGVPLLTDCPRWMVGLILDRITLGDHVGFLLAPTATQSEGGPVLTFQQARGLSPGHPA